MEMYGYLHKQAPTYWVMVQAVLSLQMIKKHGIRLKLMQAHI